MANTQHVSLHAATYEFGCIRIDAVFWPFEPSPHQAALECLSSYTGCNNDIDLSQQSSSYDDYADLCGSFAHGRSLTQSKAHPTR